MSSWEPEFVRFVDQCSGPLLRTGFLLTAGDTHLAEDLVQAALLASYRSWPRLRDRNAAFSYARVSLVNAHRDHFRRRWGRETPTPEPEESGYEPGRQLEARLDIVEALGELAPRQRAVVVCRYFEDMSEREIAEVLGCSVGTVKSQCHDAIKRLRVMPRIAGYAPTVSGEGSTLPCS